MSEVETVPLNQQGPLVFTDRPPKPSRFRVAVAWLGLMTYGAIVLWATLSPTPLDRGYSSSINRVLEVLHRNGVPAWFGYDKLEFSANIVMFIPLGFLIALILPRKLSWLAVLIVPALSGGIESVQAVALSERFATVEDVIANTVGGYVGAVAAYVIRAAVYSRDEKVIARADWDRAFRDR